MSQNHCIFDFKGNNRINCGHSTFGLHNDSTKYMDPPEFSLHIRSEYKARVPHLLFSNPQNVNHIIPPPPNKGGFINGGFNSRSVPVILNSRHN
jgi:hypothetical protein